MNTEGEPWPFPFPSSQVSSLSGRSLFLAPFPAFPDATAPLSQMRSKSQKDPKESFNAEQIIPDYTPGRG